MSSGDAYGAGRAEPGIRAQGGVRRRQEQPRTLRESVIEALEEYFEQLDGQPVTDLYNLVISEVEAPLLETVLKVTGNNQSRCARLLGLNRGTLRKKMKRHGLL